MYEIGNITNVGPYRLIANEYVNVSIDNNYEENEKRYG